MIIRIISQIPVILYWMMVTNCLYIYVSPCSAKHGVSVLLHRGEEFQCCDSTSFDLPSVQPLATICSSTAGKSTFRNLSQAPHRSIQSRCYRWAEAQKCWLSWKICAAWPVPMIQFFLANRTCQYFVFNFTYCFGCVISNYFYYIYFSFSTYNIPWLYIENKKWITLWKGKLQAITFTIILVA